ncbi:MAG: hypothetical protein JWN46_3664 [Acidimicrobiales bacterium]|nr:hypothetical protein [Acidimicrobiales bacterium]
MPKPEDLHELVSFADPDEDRTWVFDVSFLTSPWTCIFGRGCQGVLTGPAPELQHGCCSYGAHFTGPEDIAHTEKMAARLTDEQWQHRAVAQREGTILTRSDEGEITTSLVDDACIFLNRPEFPGGAGCALHRAAIDAGEPHLEWKPAVCWQLPLRLVEDTDDNGHVTSTLREWKRRDWGEGGHEFHWWCTEDDDAFVGHRPVYLELRDEIVAMVGEEPYTMLVQHLTKRVRKTGGEVYLPHPAIRAKRR